MTRCRLSFVRCSNAFVPVAWPLLTALALGLWLAARPTGAVEAQEAEATAPAADDQQAIHQELRALREAMTQAILEGDVAAQVDRVHDNVVVTWQNNEVVRTAEGLQKFMKETNSGDERVFQGYTEPPTSDEPTLLYGDRVGIAFGKSIPHYKYMGMEFDLENRWTATLVREDDGWKIAAYHVSANVMDNPVLDVVKRSLVWASGISAAVGAVVGSLATSWLKKSRAAAAER